MVREGEKEEGWEREREGGEGKERKREKKEERIMYKNARYN